MIANGFNSKTALGNAHFPIARTSDELSKFDRFFQLVAPRVKKLVYKIEPYAEGKGDALWILHELDLLDRRGGLIPVAVNLPKINLPNLISRHVMPELPPIPFKTHAARPLKEGDVVLPSATPSMNLSFEVAFGETQILDGEPLLPKLRQLILFTERVIDLFESCVFKHL